MSVCSFSQLYSRWFGNADFLSRSGAAAVDAEKEALLDTDKERN